MRTHHQICLVEDSDDDYYAFVRACRKLDVELELARFRTAEEARRHFRKLVDSGGPWPSVVFLDLNLPGTSGRDFLIEIKSNDRLKHVPVLIYSTSGDAEDVRLSYTNHANAYHQKPLDYDAMKSELRDIITYWTRRVKTVEVR